MILKAASGVAGRMTSVKLAAGAHYRAQLWLAQGLEAHARSEEGHRCASALRSSDGVRSRKVDGARDIAMVLLAVHESGAGTFATSQFDDRRSDSGLLTDVHRLESHDAV